MTKAGIIRIALIAMLLIGLESLVLMGRIDPLTMQAPHKMLFDLVSILQNGKFNKSIIKTLSNAGVAFLIALILGVIIGLVIHRLKRLREALDPLFATYYALPVFSFYPLLIPLFF